MSQHDLKKLVDEWPVPVAPVSKNEPPSAFWSLWQEICFTVVDKNGGVLGVALRDQPADAYTLTIAGVATEGFEPLSGVPLSHEERACCGFEIYEDLRLQRTFLNSFIRWCLARRLAELYPAWRKVLYHSLPWMGRITYLRASEPCEGLACQKMMECLGLFLRDHIKDCGPTEDFLILMSAEVLPNVPPAFNRLGCASDAPAKDSLTVPDPPHRSLEEEDDPDKVSAGLVVAAIEEVRRKINRKPYDPLPPSILNSIDTGGHPSPKQGRLLAEFRSELQKVLAPGQKEPKHSSVKRSFDSETGVSADGSSSYVGEKRRAGLGVAFDVFEGFRRQKAIHHYGVCFVCNKSGHLARDCRLANGGRS